MAEPLLSGPFEPLRTEHDLSDLVVEGRLPDGLEGVLYRIGPNPQFAPLGPYNPLQGEGMVHAFGVAEGRVAYRNRWVRTRRFELERAAGRALFATAGPQLNDPAVAGVDGQGAANTHVIAWDGRLLALEEGNPPIALDPASLETLGPYDFAGGLPGNMTAHPKRDPATGELVAFANFPDRRFDGALALYVAEPDGGITRSTRAPGPYPALVHDFAITARHAVFVVCPVTLSLERLRAGAAPIAWEPERGAFVGVLPRDGEGRDVRWLAAPPGMAWHTLNAFDDGDAIELDLCRQAAPAFPTPAGVAAPEADLQQRLERWTIDLAAGVVRARRLSDVVCEYPRLDERFVGRPYRYGFVAAEGGPGSGDLSHRALGRYDHVAGEMALWRAPPGCSVSEPVFAARPGSAGEGDGWILAVVYDEGRDASWLAVFEALALEAGPIARAHLAHRVPAGFHGSFVAGARLTAT